MNSSVCSYTEVSSLQQLRQNCLQYFVHQYTFADVTPQVTSFHGCSPVHYSQEKLKYCVTFCSVSLIATMPYYTWQMTEVFKVRHSVLFFLFFQMEQAWGRHSQVSKLSISCMFLCPLSLCCWYLILELELVPVTTSLTLAFQALWVCGT